MSPAEVKASPNSRAVLPCSVTFPPPAEGDEVNQSLIEVHWTTNGSDIASFGKAAAYIKDGFSWDTSQFVNGSFSLTVLKAGLSLQGVYECTVSYNSTRLPSSNVTFSILGMPLFSFLGLLMVVFQKSPCKQT